jgi:Carboxypeptidase regulatory-like domain
MRKSIQTMKTPTTRPTPSLIVRMSFQPAIPRRGALQQSSSSLHQPDSSILLGWPKSGPTERYAKQQEKVINGELKAGQVRSRSEKNRMKVLYMVLLPLIVLPLTSSNPPVAQTCAEMAYENRNQVDYGPLQLGGVRGIVQDFQGADIPKACVGIFTDVGHNLVEMSETDDRGRFSAEKVPKGVYRLVVKYPGFCPAKARVRISGGKGKSAVVHMKVAGIDTCSYIEAK